MTRANTTIIAGLVLLSGCARSGYRFGSIHSDQIETVAIPVFENQTFDHDASVRLTEALAKEIERSTRWRVTGRDVADTVILGTVIGGIVVAMYLPIFKLGAVV